MLYQELKLSHNRSKYMRSNPYAAKPWGSHMASEARQTNIYGSHGHYSQRSVVVSSNTAREGSQDALRDSEDNTQKRSSSPDYSGILKTEEVRVHHQRLSKVNGGNAIEMSSFGTR